MLSPAPSSDPLGKPPVTAALPRHNPWPFVLTLSFASAFPNAASSSLAALFYKSLGYSNEIVGYTGLLFIPFAASFLWAPWVDRTASKRAWLLGLTWALAGAFGVLAATIECWGPMLGLTLAVITLIAVLGATAELSMNGYFLHALDQQQQAAISGFRTAAIRVGGIFAGGLLLKVCADYGTARGDVAEGWVLLFGVLAVAFAASGAYHSWVLPRPVTDRPAPVTTAGGSHRRVWAEFRRVPGVGLVVAFFLIYRFGEGLLVRMVGPFLLDPPAKGGMGYTVADVAFMQGTVGVVCSMAGGILGGWLIKSHGLRRVAFPLALALTLPHVPYVWLAWYGGSTLMVQACIAVEAFGYGMGFSTMFMLMVVLGRGEYRASLAAICTGLWSVGWLVPIFFSGLIQAHVGYFWLFLLSVVTALPGLVLVLFLPLAKLEAGAARAD